MHKDNLLLTRNLTKEGPLLVILPGWAGLGQHILDLCPYSGPIVALSHTTPETVKELTIVLNQYLNENPHNQLIILGFSYGGFITPSLFSSLQYRIKHCFLVGICKKYSQKTLKFIHSKVEKDHKDYSTQFYQAALTKTEFSKFMPQYGNSILTFFSKAILLETLTHLGTLAISESTLCDTSDVPITLLHGENDVIAPLNDAQNLVRNKKNVLKIIPGACHFPFYNPVFWKTFYNVVSSNPTRMVVNTDILLS